MANTKTTTAGIVAGVGLVAKGVYELTQGDFATGITSILAGLGAFGLGWFAKDASSPK